MSTLRYTIQPVQLSIRLAAPTRAERALAKFESLLSTLTQHKPCLIFRYSKMSGKTRYVRVDKGQYFATYKMLSEKYGLTVKQVRSRLQKLQEADIIAIRRVKDASQYDMGLLITYKPVYDIFRQGSRSEGEESGKTASKSSKRAPNNKLVLSKDKQTEQNQLLQTLQRLGFTSSGAKLLLKKYPTRLVHSYLDLLSLTPGIKSKPAWLQAALHQRYSLLKVQRKKTQSVETAKSREELQKQQIEKIKRVKRIKDRKKLVEEWITKHAASLEVVTGECAKRLQGESRIMYKSLWQKKGTYSWKDFYDTNHLFRRLVADFVFQHKISKKDNI